MSDEKKIKTTIKYKLSNNGKYVIQEYSVSAIDDVNKLIDFFKQVDVLRENDKIKK